MLNKLTVSAVVLVLASAGAARAQSNSYSHMLDVTSTAQLSFYNEMNRQNALRRSVERQYEPGSQPPAPAAAHVAIGATDFVPTAPGHPVLEQYLAGMTLDPSQRAGLRQAILQVWGALEAKTRRNNLATSLGVSVAASMLVLTGKDADDAQLAEQIALVNDFLAAAPMWRGMAPPARQQISDTLLLTTSVMLIYAEVGRTDPASKQASVAIARDLLTRLGITPPPPAAQ